MTTRNLPVRSEAVNTAANYPVTPLAPYFYYSSYGLGDQIQRRHLEVSKETPFAIFNITEINIYFIGIMSSPGHVDGVTL